MARAVAFPHVPTPSAGSLGTAAAAAAAAAASLALVTVAPTGSAVRTILPAAAVIVAAALFFTQRYERSLLVLVLYIGLLDGYLKLSTGISNITLLRDVLLYSIVVGAGIRLLVRRDRVALPPMTGLVIAWVAVVLVQVFNPSGSVSHSVQATRQHLEFVPLFFFGYTVMRTNERLRGLLIAAVFIAAANGVVNLVQFGLTPQEFARWGPGYADLVNGTGGVSGRVFLDPTASKTFVRPFGLGGDFGFGGIACLFGLPPALALIILARRSKLGLAVAVPGLTFIVIGLVTSQLRTAVVGAIVAILAFCGLSIVSRKAVVSLLVVAALGGGAYWLISTFAATNERAGLARYQSIAPNRVLQTAVEDRGGTLADAPGFAIRNPLGVGLGTLGPASGEAGPAKAAKANSENEFSFLLAEVGIPGLLVLLGFLVVVLFQSVRVVRTCAEPIERLMLAALCAPVFFLAVSWFTGTSTTGSITAAYFWFVAGVLAWRIARSRESGRDALGGEYS